MCCRYPASFETGSLNAGSTGGNWALAFANLKTILRSLVDYFTVELHKTIIDLDTVDLKAIARNNDTEELLNLIELVIGAAVLCPRKSEFIDKIFKLSQETQFVLKEFIERAMSRLADADASAQDLPVDNGSSRDEDEVAESLADSGEIAHLRSERRRLMDSMQTLADTNAGLEAELETVKHELTAARAQAVASTDNHSTGALSSANAEITKLQAKVRALDGELFSARRLADQLTMDLDSRTEKCSSLQAQLKLAQEATARAEDEVQGMIDAVEVGRETAQKLLRAEASVEKFARRAEEAAALKIQVR